METYGELNNLLKEIENDSEEKVEKILQEAKEFAEEKIKKAEREAVIRKRRIIKEAEKKAEDIKRRILSNVNMEINRYKLKEREKLIEEIVNKAEIKIVDFIKNKPDEYKDFLFKLIKEIVDNIKNEKIFIIFDEADKNIIDKQFIDKVLKFFKEKDIEISEQDIVFENNIGYGVIVKIKDKHLIYNNTIKERFERKKEQFRLQIYEELFGGA